MNSNKLQLILIILGMIFLMFTIAGRSLFYFSPVLGWIGGLFFLVTSTALSFKRSVGKGK